MEGGSQRLWQSEKEGCINGVDDKMEPDPCLLLSPAVPEVSGDPVKWNGSKDGAVCRWRRAAGSP